MVSLLDLIGRIFISSVFLLSGYNKIFNFDETVTWMEGYGVTGFLLWPTNSRGAVNLTLALPGAWGELKVPFGAAKPNGAGPGGGWAAK